MTRFPTKNDNILDFFLPNRPSRVTETKPLPVLSDHDVVFVDVQAQARFSNSFKETSIKIIEKNVPTKTVLTSL